MFFLWNHKTLIRKNLTLISNKIVEINQFQIRQIDSWRLKADSWIEQDMKSYVKTIILPETDIDWMGECLAF